jgi:hypothetical protein
MKYLIALLLLSGCAKDTISLPPSPQDISLYGSAKEAFYEVDSKAAFNSQIVIENSFVNFNNKILAFYDLKATGSFVLANVDSNGNSTEGSLIANNRRFSYVLNHNNILYSFFNQGGYIFVERSYDAINWEILNNGNPVLSSEADPNSIFHYIWNVGVTVDDNEVWHMFIESSDYRDNAYANITYSNAMFNGNNIDFNINKSRVPLIEHAGNPYATFVKGKGVLLIYGKLLSPIQDLGEEWYIKAGVFDVNTHMAREKTDFTIGKAKMHICDPHMVQTLDGRLMLSYSYNQIYTHLLYSNKTVFELFDLLAK